MIRCIENGETECNFPSFNKITGYYGGYLVLTYDLKVLFFIDTDIDEDRFCDDVTNKFEIITLNT